MSQYQLSNTPPDFSQHRVQDLFNQLGPCAIFSAKHYWTAPRLVRLLRMDDEEFGFTIRGGAPAAVAGVEPKSLADVRKIIIIYLVNNFFNSMLE